MGIRAGFSAENVRKGEAMLTECRVCGGAVVELGQLGASRVYRCRKCGFEQIEVVCSSRRRRDSEALYQERRKHED